MDIEPIEEMLKKGHLEEGYQMWKVQSFEFIKNLSAGLNFYYLRQLLLYLEKNSDKEKLEEKEDEIRNLVSSYETLQQAYEQLKLEKLNQQENNLTSTENFSESEIMQINEELLDQIDQLEISKSELENVLRCKVKEFSEEIENFVQISEEKSRKIMELSDLVSEIEEKYQSELEKLKLEHMMIVKRLEDSVQKLESDKKALHEDCKGLEQHKKIYDKSLEEFKDHIASLDSKITELTGENSKFKIQLNESKISIDHYIRNIQLLENEKINFTQESQDKKQEIENLDSIIKRLQIEIEKKCEEIFELQEKVRDLSQINSNQSETIINLNIEMRNCRRQLKSSSRDLDQKSFEVETVRKSLEKYKQEFSRTRESSRILESCSSKLIHKKRELSVQSDKLSAIQTSFQTLSYDLEASKIKNKQLENDLESKNKKIDDLLNEIEILRSSAKDTENQLRTGYLSLCNSTAHHLKPLDSISSIISEVFAITSNLQKELDKMEEVTNDLTSELESKSDIDRAKTDEVLMKCEQIEYLMNQITYLNEINKGLENQRLACQKVLADFLDEDCINDFKGISIVIEKFNVMVKENKALIHLVDSEKRRCEDLEKERIMLRDEVKFLKDKLEKPEHDNLKNSSKSDTEMKNLQVLLREYRKHKQEQENKIKILQKSLSDACRLRDVLADELSEKCDIIENLTKNSLYKNFN